MRLGYFLLIWTASVATVFAQTASDPLDACAGLKEDSARLACFDRQMALKHATPAAAPQAGAAQPQAGGAQPSGTPPPSPRAPAVAPSAQPGSAPSAQPAPAPSAQPGSALSVQPAPAPSPQPSVSEPSGQSANIETMPNTRTRPQPITATIAQFVALPNGDIAFRLDNGQLWLQTDERSYLNARVKDHITITRSALGAFFLTTSGGLHIRVKRIQ
jgi:hypothetical protein